MVADQTGERSIVVFRRGDRLDFRFDADKKAIDIDQGVGRLQG